jgi:hypothetical protein
MRSVVESWFPLLYPHFYWDRQLGSLTFAWPWWDAQIAVGRHKHRAGRSIAITPAPQESRDCRQKPAVGSVPPSGDIARAALCTGNSFRKNIPSLLRQRSSNKCSRGDLALAFPELYIFVMQKCRPGRALFTRVRAKKPARAAGCLICSLKPSGARQSINPQLLARLPVSKSEAHWTSLGMRGEPSCRLTPAHNRKLSRVLSSSHHPPVSLRPRADPRQARGWVWPWSPRSSICREQDSTL